MRIRQHLMPYFLSVVAILCLVFLYPVFADMEKVDEDELARANAPVIGKEVLATIIDNSQDSSVRTAAFMVNATEATPAMTVVMPVANLNNFFSAGTGSLTVTFDNKEIDISEPSRRAMMGLIGNNQDMGVFYINGMRVTPSGSFTVIQR